VSYDRLTNNQLLVEAIRRCRVRQIPKISYVAFAAATPGAIIQALDGMMDPHEMRVAVNNLLAEGTICVTCRVATLKEDLFRYFHSEGLLKQYHPELRFNNYQRFSPAGIPIQRRQKETAGTTHISIRGLYMITDGLPAKVQKLLDQEKYIYPT